MKLMNAKCYHRREKCHRKNARDGGEPSDVIAPMGLVRAFNISLSMAGGDFVQLQATYWWIDVKSFASLSTTGTNIGKSNRLSLSHWLKFDLIFRSSRLVQKNMRMNSCLTLWFDDGGLVMKEGNMVSFAQEGLDRWKLTLSLRFFQQILFLSTINFKQLTSN